MSFYCVVMYRHLNTGHIEVLYFLLIIVFKPGLLQLHPMPLTPNTSLREMFMNRLKSGMASLDVETTVPEVVRSDLQSPVVEMQDFDTFDEYVKTIDAICVVSPRMSEPVLDIATEAEGVLLTDTTTETEAEATVPGPEAPIVTDTATETVLTVATEAEAVVTGAAVELEAAVVTTAIVPEPEAAVVTTDAVESNTYPIEEIKCDAFTEKLLETGMMHYIFSVGDLEP